MLCFTLISMKTYNDMTSCKVKDIPVVPIGDIARDTFVDILFTQWPSDATVALALNIPDENIEKFSYYKLGQEDAFEVPSDHYAGYICRKVDGTVHEASEEFKNMKVSDILSSVELRYLLASFNSEFLLCKVIPKELLDTFVSDRISGLKHRIFGASFVEADDVNNLLHMLETFCVINQVDVECLKWCRENCPPALKFYNDSELIKCMSLAWLNYVKS